MSGLADLTLLLRRPRAGVAAVLERPSWLIAFPLMTVATVTATLVAAQTGRETDVNEMFLAGTRVPLVQVMIDTFGPQRTAVVLYLVQRSFDAVVVATAFSPLFYWLLGSTAVHASARLAGARRPFRPLLLLLAHAVPLTLVPANLVALAVGAGRGPGPQLASAAGVLAVAWLVLIVYRGIERHYGVERDRALRILVVAILVFYVVPLVLIVGAAVAIVVAAVMLEYF